MLNGSARVAEPSRSILVLRSAPTAVNSGLSGFRAGLAFRLSFAGFALAASRAEALLLRSLAEGPHLLR